MLTMLGYEVALGSAKVSRKRIAKTRVSSVGWLGRVPAIREVMNSPVEEGIANIFSEDENCLSGV